MFVGIGGVIAAIRTLRAIQKQAGLMETQIEDARKSNAENAMDVQASIAEAVRSAKAMEVVADSMAANAESMKASVKCKRLVNVHETLTVLSPRLVGVWRRVIAVCAAARCYLCMPALVASEDQLAEMVGRAATRKVWAQYTS